MADYNIFIYIVEQVWNFLFIFISLEIFFRAKYFSRKMNRGISALRLIATFLCTTRESNIKTKYGILSDKRSPSQMCGYDLLTVCVLF